jgi:hypothetical protein
MLDSAFGLEPPRTFLRIHITNVDVVPLPPVHYIEHPVIPVYSIGKIEGAPFYRDSGQHMGYCYLWLTNIKITRHNRVNARDRGRIS